MIARIRSKAGNRQERRAIAAYCRHPLIIAGIIAALFSGCSLGPVAGGGTETGNPEIVACASAAFGIMAADSQWIPEYYLPGGTGKLDPATLIPATVRSQLPAPLGKTASRIDTVINGMRYVYINDTLIMQDTVIRPDINFVKDTLVVSRNVADTIVDSASGDRYVAERVVTDTIFVIDTLVLHDTTVTIDTMLYRDTLMFADTSQAAPVTLIDSTKLVRLSDMRNTTAWRIDSVFVAPDQAAPAPKDSSLPVQPSYAIYYSVAGAPSNGLDQSSQTINVPAENYFVIQTPGKYRSLSRRFTTSAGVTGSELYADRDGDSLLFTALPLQVPAVRYTCDLSSSAIAQSGTYDFNAGPDRSFATVNGNIICGLNRFSRSGAMQENVSYAHDSTDVLREHMVLALGQIYASDSVETLTVRYEISGGSDSLGLADDRLLAIRESIAYRTGFLSRIDLVIRPDLPLSRGQKAQHGIVSFSVLLRNGDYGTMDNGIIDLRTGTISGIYRKTEARQVTIQ